MPDFTQPSSEVDIDNVPKNEKPNVDAGAAKSRGFLLTAWLVLMLITAVIGAFANLSAPLVGFNAYVPSWAYLILGLVSVANIAFAIMLIKWKLYGLYGYVGATVIAIVVNVSVGVTLFSSFLGLIGPAVLYLLMRPKWKMFS